MVGLYKVVNGDWELVDFGVKGIDYPGYLVVLKMKPGTKIGSKLIRKWEIYQGLEAK